MNKPPTPSAKAFSSPACSCRLHEGVRGLTTSRLALAEGDAPASTSTFSAEGADPESFKKEFAKFASSTMAPPQFPSDFLPKEDKAGDKEQQAVPDKLTFSFYLPHEQIAQKAKARLMLLSGQFALTGRWGLGGSSLLGAAGHEIFVDLLHKQLIQRAKLTPRPNFRAICLTGGS